MAYRVFVRNWWKKAESPGWPNGLEPDPSAPRTVLRKRVETEEEARHICQQFNKLNPPGRLSRKAEYEEI